MSDAEHLLRKKIVDIIDDEHLKNVCAQLLQKRLIAIDTEFMRVDTYYPLAAVIQINDGDTNYLIDPLCIRQWQPLAAVLQSPAVIKAFHACSEDLDVFNTLLGVLPKQLFDTQVAAALLGMGASVGYGNLVNACLNVDLPKGETRSNWLARPLTVAQIHYAALDVDYLYELALLLEQQLIALNRETWLYEESQALLDNYIANLDPASGFNKSNNTWRLKPLQLAKAKALFEWREHTAISKNTPRSRLIKDAQIFDIFFNDVKNLVQLKLVGLHDGAIRKYGAQIIDICTQEKLPDIELKPSQLPLTKQQREYVKNLRDVVSALAEQFKISPEILLRKNDYHTIARYCADESYDIAVFVEHTQGWRHQFFSGL
ncbi:MAG: ribonuclease D [Marinagarivorans sp.]|nr:ribonuclease D [Marinagarivorans sp.]